MTLSGPPFEYPPAGVGAAVRRHWFLMTLCVVVFVGAGAAYGLKRKPTYTARAKLSVGHVNLTAPGALSGYAQATTALASAYARAVDADGVVLPVARQAGLPAQTVRDRVDATPVPDSPIFRVDATGKNKGATIRLANLTTSALVAYITQLNQQVPDAPRLYARFVNATAKANAHRMTEQRLAKMIAQTPHPSSALRAAEVRSKTAADTAAARAQALKQAYTNALAGQSNTQTVEILAPASSTRSDRTSKLEILLFAGLVAGLLVGTALATLRAGRVRRRMA